MARVNETPTRAHEATEVRSAPAPASASRPAPEADPVAALGRLVATVDSVCEDLFATVPFPGDQSTGAALNRYVDEAVSALRVVRDDADDLLRAMTVARARAGTPSRGNR